MAPPDLSALERVGNLSALRDQLLDENREARFACPFYYSDGDYCERSCRKYRFDHSRLFENMSKLLSCKVDDVNKEDFIAVVRTMFCDTHDPTKQKTYKSHLMDLWEDATITLRSEIWDAFRKREREEGASWTPQRRPPMRNEATAPAAVPIKTEYVGSRAIISHADTDRQSRPQSAQGRIDHIELSAEESPLLRHARDPGPDHTPSKNDERATGYSPSSSPSIRPTRRIFVAGSRHEHTILKPYAPSRKPCNLFGFSNTIRGEEAQPVQTGQDDEPQLPTSGKEQSIQITGRNQNEEGQPAHSKIQSSPATKRSVFQTYLAPKTSTSEFKISCDQQEQAIESPKLETIFQKLELQAVSSTPRRVVEPPGNERSKFDPKVWQGVFGSGGKSPAVPERQEKQTRPEVLPTVAQALRSSITFSASAPDLTEATKKSGNISPASAFGGAATPAKKMSPTNCFNTPLSQKAIAMNMSKILQKPIEVRKGAIYILQAPEFFRTFPPASSRNEQWIKIGITANIEERIKGIRIRCGIDDLKEVDSWGAGTRMDLLYRIESLCHEELRNYKRTLDCKGKGTAKGKCTTAHDEWFAVDHNIAKETVKRWVRFLEQEPYEDGALAKFWKDRLGDKHVRIDTDDGKADHKLLSSFNTWLEEGLREKK